MSDVKPPETVYFVAGHSRSRLYMSRGHVKLRIAHRGLWSSRIYKLELGSSEWVDVTEEFKEKSS